MSGRKRVVAILLAVLLVGAALAAGAEAKSDNITHGLLIGGVTAGVVGTVLLVATLVEGSEEPEFLELTSRPPRSAGRRRVKLGCPPVDGTLPLICW